MALPLLALLLATSPSAQPLAPRKSLTAVRTKRPPEMDGRLLDPVWQQAPVALHFTQRYPNEGKAPTEKTEVRVLYDDDSVYIGVSCHDDDPTKIVARLTRRDRWIESDWVTVRIDSRLSRTTAEEFSVSAAGVLVDALLYDDNQRTTDWDANWEAQVARGPGGWTAEFRIPLKILHLRPGADQVWGLQVSRRISRREETDQWVYVPLSASGVVSRFGHLVGLHDLRPKVDLEGGPYLAPRLRHRSLPAGTPGPTGWDTSATAGGDFKVGLTRRLVLDGTVNPDFSEVEADQVILNLTTFETYYPEKRPFFLEGMELFQPPVLGGPSGAPADMQLFYTRRVGQVSPQAPLQPGQVFVDEAPAAPIFGALKLTGRLGDHLSIAALDALTAPVDALVGNGGIAPTQLQALRLLDPTNFSVVRLRQDLGTHSAVGLTATAVDPAQGAPQATCGNGLAPVEGRCFHDAYTQGVDWVLFTENDEYAAMGQLVASELAGGPQELQPDGTVLQGGSLGTGGQLRLMKSGGEHWLGRIDYEFESPLLDLNDAGYLLQGNYQHERGRVTWRTLHPHGALQQQDYNVGASAYQSFYGPRGAIDLGQHFWTHEDLTLTNFWSLGLGGNAVPGRYFDHRELRDGTPLEWPAYWESWGYLNTDNRKPFVGSLSAWQRRGLEATSYPYYEYQLNADLMAKLGRHLDLEFIGSYEHDRDVPRWVSTANQTPSEADYLLAPLDSQSISLTVRATYAFSPTLSLQLYTQLFSDNGTYGPFFLAAGNTDLQRKVLLSNLVPTAAPSVNPDFSAVNLNVNLVLRWEYRLGSVLYAVYTRAASNSPAPPMAPGAEGQAVAPQSFANVTQGPAIDIFLVKLSYWFGA